MVYKYDDCIEKIGTRTVPLLCKHRFSQRERLCNGVLLRHVELKSKKEVYYPNRIYSYMPLVNYLRSIHGRNFTKPFDPRNLSDWTLSGLSDICLPKSYTRSIVSNEMLSQLKNMYSSLNPNLSLQNTSFNTACKKFSTDI